MMSVCRSRLITGLWLLAVSGGCAAGPDPVPDLKWPPPPEKARFQLVDILKDNADQKRTLKQILAQIVFGGVGTGALQQPTNVVADSAGNVFVSDPGLAAIVVFNREERDFRLIGKTGKGRLWWPIGLALADSLIYVSDSRLAKILVYNKNGNFIRELAEDAGFVHPSSLAIHEESRRLYVADSYNHNVLILNLDDGAVLKTIGSRGSEDGQFNFPNYIAVKNDKLYVVDAMNFRVQIFTPEGDFITKFGEVGDSPGYMFRPKGIGVTNDGYIFVVDSEFNNFQIFDEEGNVYMYVGTPGINPGEFSSPAGIFVDHQDLTYVVDQANRRVQVFKFLGSD